MKLLVQTKRIRMKSFCLILVCSLFLIQCAQAPLQTDVSSKRWSASTLAVQPSEVSDDWVDQLPTETSTDISPDLFRKIQSALKKQQLGDVEAARIGLRLQKYLDFLTYNYENLKKQRSTDFKDVNSLKSDILTRLFSSSTQFLLCPNLSDFSCLEKTPLITPSIPSRIEKPEDKLGEMVELNESLENNIEWYFNTQIFKPESDYNSEEGVARVLIDKIKKDGVSAIYMALYGIDDITVNDKNKTIGSMSGVYQALMEKIQAKVPVFGVFDENGANAQAPKPLILSYIKPTEDEQLKKWILTPLSDDGIKTNLDFQYNEGTQNLIKALAEGAKSEDEARGRLEYPNRGIMHNKFLVLYNKKNDHYGVWTGTANITRTCMGTERNSNMSVYIQSKAIAKTYLKEFAEMYKFQPADPNFSDNNFVGRNQASFPRGLFHTNKKPNTKRYFKFNDGYEAKVYFSPTDDSEHRAILPMLHSARPGDIIRISMFGAAGIEYVRALQLAAARGVKVEVIVDSPTACGVNSWAGRTGDTLLETNPFDSKAHIEVRKNAKGPGQSWKQNHQKIGLLLRYDSQTKQHKAEQITFGSQNWSSSGNDLNDENMIFLRKKDADIPLGQAFNKHFTEFLWPKAQVVSSDGCSGPVDAKDDGKEED